jgi:hypothetical protein
MTITMVSRTLSVSYDLTLSNPYLGDTHLQG